MDKGKEGGGQEFVPLGAIAFIMTMVLVYSGIWFSIFALMAARG